MAPCRTKFLILVSVLIFAALAAVPARAGNYARIVSLYPGHTDNVMALGAGAKRTLVVLALMIILLATGLIPAPVAGLLAALAVIATRVLSVQQAYDGIGWTTVILVGGLMSLSTAMVSSGAAQQLADALVALVGDAGPYALLAGLFVVTTTLGQLISNMATAFIVVPVGLAAAIQMDVSPAPILMAIAVFAAAALLTPVATPCLSIETPARVPE